ncbi:MAG: ATP-dependent RNA helicase HrpA [Verrucomicrobiota bacterium]
MKIRFPEELPVSRRRDEIAKAIAKHQVVIVCGDTGSGKTTQLPKIALKSGAGKKGKRIGCTQPRRIAATSVAQRVADEMDVTLGKEVGYQIRFEDRTEADSTVIKFMTDGVLLAETRNDRDLRQYDTLIIDEAHERSLNIDFILGYLHRILKRRPDLKVILSSATLDAGVFSEFFGGAPVVEVEGRTFPVEDAFQKPLNHHEPLADQIGRAVEDLAKVDRLGDTLVFLPGEREIRDAADLLEGRRYADTLVLPLFARLAGKEQQRVFRPQKGMRRLVLATNVAETSLTIPGIRFVIDSGLARVSRHDPGSGIQRLQIEPISKASARQRRGRCGRVSEGMCVRLYSEEDFEERDDYTDPEILRSNLSGVVLQMEHLGLGDPLAFPFVDPPQPKRIAQAYRVLDEIGAVEKEGKTFRLTGVGKTLARLPVDPRIGRVLVGAKDENCLMEALIVASALAVQDPRERPRDKQEAADSAHGQFRDKRSDFTGWLRWWHALTEARGRSNNQLRKFCQKNFLNYRRVQEWINLHRELCDTLKQLRWKLPPPQKRLDDPADTYSEPLHRSILAAIPSQIGMSQGQKKGYQGARNSVFFLFPGSGTFRASPSWVMAFEMVETAKLYARNAAMFDPGWVEKVAPHLCRYRYSNPHWDKNQGAVYGHERVIAFGLPVVDKRPIHYGRIDQRVAREVFLLEALVNGNTRAPLPALESNRQTLAAAERLEHKLRRLGGLVYPEAIVAFYEERLPESIHTQRDFEKWVANEDSGVIDFSLEDCLLPQVEPIRVEEYPDTVLSPDGETELELFYLHNPSEIADGITLRVPLVELPHLPPWFGSWLVAGWLPEKVSSLLRCLRKEVRTLLPSNREVVESFVSAWEGYEPHGGLLEALIDFLMESYEIELTNDSFDLDRIPEFLRMRFEVEDDSGKLVGEGRDLSELQSKLAGRVKERFVRVSQGQFRRDKICDWSFGDLPVKVELDRHTQGYPRLFDRGEDGVAMRLWPDSKCALVQHRMGVSRLFQITHPDEMRRFLDVLFGSESSASTTKPVRSKPKQSGASNFGSLAAAFGETPTAVGSDKADLGKSSQTSASEVKACQLLTHHEGWLLSNLGIARASSGRGGQKDLIHRLLGEVMGAPLRQGEWKTTLVGVLDRLHETAPLVCAPLSKILKSAESVGGLLESDHPGYEESIEDAKEHYANLLAPGWLLASDLKILSVHWQGLETRLTRMLGSAPVKDLEKLDRYLDRSSQIWANDGPCECGQCPEAVARAEILAQDFDLRLQVFAPELKSRLK